MKKTSFVLIVIVLQFSLAAIAMAVAGGSTGWGWCAICGTDMPPDHDFTHGGGNSGGYSTGNDPFMQAMTPVLGAMFNQIGQNLANSMFGDPAQEARQQALRQEQQRLQAQEAQTRQAEQARLQEIAHERLMKSLKLTSTAVSGLRLKSLDDEEFGWDGRATAGKAATGGAGVGSDVVDLRPAGTSFFGTGGGPTEYGDSSVVDLRDYQRARDLAQAAAAAQPEDRALLLNEAERAVDGNSTFTLDPNQKSPPADAVRYRSFQEADRAYRDAEHGLSAARGRLGLADKRVAVASQVIRQLEQEIDRQVASSADAAVIAEKRRLLDEARKALAACEAERRVAGQEVQISQAVRNLTRWGRRQELATSGGCAREPLPQQQEQDLSKLQRIYTGKTVPPLPEMPGWVARAEAGRRALQQTERYAGQVAACPEENRAQAEIQLDRVRHKAEMMATYDRILNAQRLERVESLKELQEIQAEAGRKVNSFAAEAVSTIEGAIGDFRADAEKLLKDSAWQKADTALKLNEKMESSRDLTTELASLKAGIESGTMDPESASKLLERASTWSVELAKDLGALKRMDPVLAERVFARTGFWVKASWGVARTADRTIDLVALNQAATQRSDDSAASAEYSKRLQEIYKRQVDGFHQESRRLDGLLARPAS